MGMPANVDWKAVGPPGDMWRVDVAGVPVSVRGEVAYRYLRQVNSHLARMKLALHKIKGGHSTDPQYDAMIGLAEVGIAEGRPL